MNLIEEAIIYATVMHQGIVRKFKKNPYILHPLEVAQILSTMTDDQEIISAGILHDIVEDTDGTLAEIERRFGKRVAFLVESESESKYPNQEKHSTWKWRKEESLAVLKNTNDLGVKMLWLADKLSNIRSLARNYAEEGNEIWQSLNQRDPEMQCWYYRTVAETLELSLNKTGAFKEYIYLINYIWPGTFDPKKSRFRKYREVSVEGSTLIGRGAKGDVYRYDEELVIKVYNHKNTYADVEREIFLSRQAFILGIPTAISFGIVSVGIQYGAMYELVDSLTISSCIARNPSGVDKYAKIMAELAHTVHGVNVSGNDIFPDGLERVLTYIREGIGREDEGLAKKCLALIDKLPKASSLIHGDFHTNNVFIQRGEPLLIDLDRISKADPIIEISDLYYFYVVLGEDDPSVVESFMGFSYKTSKEFFKDFLRYYIQTEDQKKLDEVIEKADIISCTRMIKKLRGEEKVAGAKSKLIKKYKDRLAARLEKVDSLGICG